MLLPKQTQKFQGDKITQALSVERAGVLLPVCVAAAHCGTEPEAHRSSHMCGTEEK